MKLFFEFLPGGFGAQFGFPWFGTTLLVVVDVIFILCVALLKEFDLLFVLLLLLSLHVSTVELVVLVFANSDDLFGTNDVFVPFNGNAELNMRVRKIN